MLEYAELDGLVIQDVTGPDRIFMVSEVTGLTGFAAVRGDTFDRPQNDGAIEPPNQQLPAKFSNFTVLATGEDVADARRNWTILNRALIKSVRVQKTLKWRWLGDDLNFQAAVRCCLMVPPDITTDNQGAKFSSVVTFRHADPANYDQSAQTVATGAPSFDVLGLPFPIPFPIPWALVGSGAGTVAMSNNGDTDGWPVISIAGPITNPVIQNQSLGLSIYFDGLTVAAGETLVIDTNPASRSASIGGVSKFSALRRSASEFFPVSAGETQQITFSGTGTDEALTTMTVSLRSAYVS